MKKKMFVLLVSAVAGFATAALGQVMSGPAPNPACTNLQLWLKADAGVASGGDGTGVTTWTNQSTATVAVGNATADVIGTGNAPIFTAASSVLNNQPAISFDGLTQGLDILNASTLMAGGQYTLFVVLQTAGPNTAGVWHYVQAIMANNYNVVFMQATDPWTGTQYNDTFAIQSGPPNWNTIASSVSISNSASFLLAASSTGALPGNTHLYIDGAQDDSGGPMSAFNLSDDWNMGYQGGGQDRWFHGEIAEVLVYQGVLLSSDALKVTDYLGAKFGITVPVQPGSTPSFSLPSGTYSGAQSVNISSDSGSTVFYTTNGSAPTIASAHGPSPVSVVVPANVTGLTINAFATNTGFANSAVASATYSTVSMTPSWISPASGSWTNASNWSSDVIANGSGVTADFSKLTLSGDIQVTVDGAYTIGNLLFRDMGNAHGWFLDYGSSGPLTLDAGANMPVVTVSNQSVTIGASSAYGPLSSAKGLIKAGAGTLVFTGPSTYTGPTAVNAGLLVLSNTSVFGSSSITNNAQVALIGAGGKYTKVDSIHGGGAWIIDGNGTGGVWDSSATVGQAADAASDNTGTLSVINDGKLWIQLWSLTSNPIGDTANVDIGPNAGFYLYGINGATETIGGLSGSGIVDIPDGGAGTSLTLAVGGGDKTATFSGIIENTASYPWWQGGPTFLSLAKVGAGVQTLSGANTYSGTTTVSQGTLLVDGSIGNSSEVQVQGGALGGVGTITAPVIVNAGGTLSPGDNNLGTLSIAGNLTLGGDTLIEVNKALNPSNDVVNVTGTLAYGGTLTATNRGAVPLKLGDQFQVFPAGGTGSLTLAGSPGTGLSWSFNSASGILSVVQGVAAPTLGFSRDGTSLTFNWTGTFKLQSKTNSLNTGSWHDYPAGNVSPIIVTVNPTNTSVFYRLVSP